MAGSHKRRSTKRYSVGSRRQVYNGSKDRTSGWLFKQNLILKDGTIKSRRKVALGKKMWREMPKTVKAKFEANMGRGFSKGRRRKSTGRRRKSTGRRRKSSGRR